MEITEKIAEVMYKELDTIFSVHQTEWKNLTKDIQSIYTDVANKVFGTITKHNYDIAFNKK